MIKRVEVMKLYSFIYKLIFGACLILALLLIINIFTGVINAKITGGATVICLSAIVSAMMVTYRVLKYHIIQK